MVLHCCFLKSKIEGCVCVYFKLMINIFSMFDYIINYLELPTSGMTFFQLLFEVVWFF